VLFILTLSGLFTFLGVYDSDSMSFLHSFWFWSSTISTGTISGLLIVGWVFKGLPSKQHIIIKLITISVIATIPVVFVIAAFSGGWAGAWPWHNWFLQYGLAFVITLLVNTGIYVTLKAIAPTTTHDSIEQQPQIKNFLQRLPQKYHDAELLALSSADHYLQVHTDIGTELILYRLSDALKELSHADGLQTHRSWWVARNGIAETISKNGKYSLVLKSGAIAPISRSFSNAVRKAYFI